MNDTVHLENLLNLPRIIERLIDENWSLYVLNQVLCHQTVMRVFLVVSNTLAIWKRYDLISKTNYSLNPPCIVVGASLVGRIVDEEPGVWQSKDFCFRVDSMHPVSNRVNPSISSETSSGTSIHYKCVS